MKLERVEGVLYLALEDAVETMVPWRDEWLTAFGERMLTGLVFSRYYNETILEELGEVNSAYLNGVDPVQIEMSHHAYIQELIDQDIAENAN